MSPEEEESRKYFGKKKLKKFTGIPIKWLLFLLLTFAFIFFCKFSRTELKSSSAVLTLAYLLHVLYKLWMEESFADRSIFHPDKTKETTTLWKNTTNAKEVIHYFCKETQNSSFSPKFNHPNYHHSPDNHSENCPLYFNFIHQDLEPWKKSGITLEAVEKAQKEASFRVMVVNGSLFVESFHHCFQTRDLFTVWGIAQLLRMYPGMVPDLDLMFNCKDKTTIHKDLYRNTQPPPLFRYSSSEDTFDIAFPDWSFWGWVELQIPPWKRSIQDIQKGYQQVDWLDRDPTAYWKGNPFVSPKRLDLMTCSGIPNWKGRLYIQMFEVSLKSLCNLACRGLLYPFVLGLAKVQNSI